MLRVSALLCLLTAAAAQQIYYCDSFGRDSIEESDFYLITRRQGESTYPPGLICRFSAESQIAVFLVEISFFNVRDAVLTINSGGQTLFRGSRVQRNESSIVTTSRSLQVRFDSSVDNSYRSGVQIRVRSFGYNGCPPGWTYLQGNCFGTSRTSGSLNFFDAQRACNSMRSNLMQLPGYYYDTVRSLVNSLPSQLTSQYTWIGLTDRAGRFRHYWLNGNRYYLTSEISCQSSGDYSTCFTNERCGTIYDKSFLYGVYMADCDTTKPFVCSMPPGGTGSFYTVPNVGVAPTTTWPPFRPDYSYTDVSWVWLIAIGCLFTVGLIVSGIIIRVRRIQARNAAAGATGVIVTSGRVVIAPPPGSCPVQPPMYFSGPQAPNYYPAPPSYDTAVADGHINANYMG